MPTRYPIRLGRRSRPFLRLWGVTPDRAEVRLDGHVDARFGFFRIRTPVANIRRWRIEGPWLWITAIGVRRGFRHGDITFCGDPRGGVRIDFETPIRWGLLRVPALYLCVEDLEGFAAELSGRGIPGQDARKG
ncbi:MAG TPA: hypothetical protein VM344_06570 [Vitreimonas sp.]|jgi:hypothetical protein|nr:hypothetical protein [Vitreimonas sp.]